MNVEQNVILLTKKIDKSYNLQTNLLSNVTRLKAALLKSTEIFFKQINVEGLRRCVQSFFSEKFFHSSSIDMWWIKDAIDSNNRKKTNLAVKKEEETSRRRRRCRNTHGTANFVPTYF